MSWTQTETNKLENMYLLCVQLFCIEQNLIEIKRERKRGKMGAMEDGSVGD